MTRREIVRRSVTLGFAAQATSLPGAAQDAELDPATRWAAMAACEFRRFPNHERSPFNGADIVYGRAGGVDLRLDIFTPGAETEIRPTLVSIHGGGWVHLMKEDTLLYGLPWLAQGMNVVNVEYRIANQALAPAAVEDCRRAMQWVHKHAGEYGIDTDRLVVGGESAGGHLALMTGMLNQEAGFDNEFAYSNGDKPISVRAIVNFCGITDVNDLLSGPNRRTWAVEWLGANPDREQLAGRLSPLSYVRAGLPPVITLHGSEDSAVPYDHAVRLHRGLDQAGVRNELVTVPKGGHGMRAWPRSEGQRVHARIFKFLRQVGVLASR